MKNNKLESFAEFSAKELNELDKLNVLEENKIIGGKKPRCGAEKATSEQYCIDARCEESGEILWEQDV